jgi:hypothetical protein
LEHDASGDAAVLDVGDRLVDLLERADLARDVGAARRVELEHFAQLRPGADDRADDRDAVEHGLEDRQRHLVVRRQGDEHERAAATQRGERLLERARRYRQRDRLIGAAEGLDRLDRVLLGRVDGELGTQLAGEFELLVVQVDRDDAPARDRGVLDRQMAETADAEDGDEIRRAGARRP